MAFLPQARAVLDKGRALWTRYHATDFPRLIRDEVKLHRPDAGWYQVRRALKAHDDAELVDFAGLCRADRDAAAASPCVWLPARLSRAYCGAKPCCRSQVKVVSKKVGADRLPLIEWPASGISTRVNDTLGSQ